MKRNLSMPNRVSTLALAVALVAGATPASAQFVGTIDSSAGIDTVNSTNSNLIITGQQAVVNWTANATPNSGQIVFLPDGNSATFNGTADFAVLNRVTPGTAGNAIYMGGNITSLINTSVGGTVFFYSPNGIIIGQNAVINVGALGLTTLPITDDGQGNWMSGFGSGSPQVNFGQATDPNSFIRTNAVIDGSINAHGAGSYVAMVAPMVQHSGLIRTDGAAALVAAEAATITFSPTGLFDIEVTVGTDASTGIHVDGGTIERRDATEGTYDHRAYLVAVAKNDAVTMLVNNGGSVGFDTATSATVENNVVVLSGGRDISGGEFSAPSGTSTVNLDINNASFSSDVAGQLSGALDINSFSGAVDFGGDLAFTTAGNAAIHADNGNLLSIAGNVNIQAYAEGPNGSLTGQQIYLGAENGSTLDIGGNVILDVHSEGADADQFGVNGGDATGGIIDIHPGANSMINIAGFADLNAHAEGGFAQGDARAGNGTGGRILVMALSGNASLTIGGPVDATADGQGGSVIECTVCNVIGGDGLGGEVSVHTNLAAGNLLQINGDLAISASGSGGFGDAQAGDGFGGLANVSAGDGSTLRVGADTLVVATGQGGYGDQGTGGTGVGGVARISTFGGPGNLIELAGPAFVIADGEGGQGATGGTGTGGQAFVSSVRGTIHAFGDLTVFANSSGGAAFSFDGPAIGGDGIADTETATTASITEAFLFSGAGTLRVDGQTFVAADAFGGEVESAGSGGNAVAGSAMIHVGNRDEGMSIIELGEVIVTADAQGGDGSSGLSGTNGGNGGDGGDATAGRVIVTAAAGSGDLTAGSTIVSASAIGGSGGSGGNGDGGSGGNGGDGGDATGGFINIGTESGDVNFAQGANNGSATYGSILSLTTATGGTGGNAGSGAPPGTAGNGGDALGGQNALLVRGSVLNVGNVQLDSSAFGGNGGLDTLDSPQGTGGDAVTGDVTVLVTNRFNIDAQRGTLNAGFITGTASASGGVGSVNGNEYTVGGSASFEVVNSDATIDGVNLEVTAADGVDPNATETFSSLIAVVNGAVDIANGFEVSTPGRISIHANSGTLNALTFNVAADNFVHDEFRALPATVGTISADSMNLVTGQDLVVDANLVSTGPLDLIAPGLIDIEGASSGVSLLLDAGSTITGGSMTSAGAILAFAPGNITLGLVNAGADINVISTDGSLSLASLSSPTSIFLEAAGNIGFGDVTADDLDFEAGGAVTGGDIVAGTSATGEAQGAVSLGDINVGVQLTGGTPTDGFAVGIVSATSIDVGDVIADENIGFATFGDLSTGNLAGGDLIMALVGADISVGSMATNGPNGEIYLADASMFIDAGGPDNFDPLQVLNSEPVPTGGSIAIGGSVTTDFLSAAADGLISLNGSVTAASSRFMSSDIAIANGITVSGFASLNPINSQGTFVGDGLAGPGYMLSNAEYNSFQDVSIEVRPDLGAAPLLVLGDLNIAGGVTNAAFGIEDADDNDVGTIRVLGDVRMNNADGILEFESEIFQLDAATGSIVISADGTTPGGELVISANHIHVAEGDILDQLAADPQYDGYQDDLNRPAAVQNANGVIRASQISLELGSTPAELYTIYVQNSGTSDTPAGFLIGDIGLDGSEGALPANSIDLIINGKGVTANGTLTGVNVRDLLVLNRDLTPFTTNSTINGCLLNGACGQVEPPPPPEPPIPPGFTPTPGIQDEVVLVDDNLLPQPDFGNEDFIDDNDDETEGGEGPIDPPSPLFDTSELGDSAGTAGPEVGTSMRSSPGMSDKDEVDDPVSGSGNPGLMDTPPHDKEDKQ